MKLSIQIYLMSPFFQMNYLYELRNIYMVCRTTETRVKSEISMYPYYKKQVNILLAVLPKTTCPPYNRLQRQTRQCRIEIGMNNIKLVSYSVFIGKNHMKLEEGKGKMKGKNSSSIKSYKKVYMNNKLKIYKGITKSRHNVYKNWCYTGSTLSGKGRKLKGRPP